MTAFDIDSVSNLLAKASVYEDSELLTFAGRGLKLDNEDDAKEIVEVLRSFKNLKAFELKGNTLGINAAKAVGEGLKSHPEFERALWSDLFTGRLKTEIPDALRFLCGGIIEAKANLVELDLSDNAFGPNGMTGLVDFLKSSSCYTLQELRLNNNGLGIQGGKMLAESLLSCYKSSLSTGKPLALRVFVSGRGRLEDEGATALAEAFKAMKSLEEVHMPQNGINHKGITALAEAFKFNLKLRHLNLSDNTFTEKGSISMAQAMISLQQLEIINFEDCLVRTEGAKVLANALKGGHKKLKELKLSGNEINRNGVDAIISALSNKDDLKLLELNANQLGEDGIENVREMMKSLGKADILGSFSDDEGSEDENEDEKEGDEDEETDEDDETDDVKVEDKFSTPAPPPKKVTAEEFLQFPSPLKLQQISERQAEQLISHLGNLKENTENGIKAFMKVSLVVTSSDEATKKAAFTCADEILSRLFQSAGAEAETQISTSLLVNMGLLKSEDKKFVPPSSLQGPLVVLEHVVRQSYFPQTAKDMLKTFITKPHALLEKCSDVKQSLLTALSS